MRSIRIKLVLTVFLLILVAFLLPLAAFAQVDPSADPVALLTQILAAVQSKQWPVVVPLVALALIWAARVGLRSKLPWLATDKGGAALGLIAAVATAALAAVSLPGAHTAGGVIAATFAALLANQTVFALLKKLGLDLSVDPAPAARPGPAADAPKGFGRVGFLAILAGALVTLSGATCKPAPVVTGVLKCGEDAVVKRLPELTAEIVKILREGAPGWQALETSLIDAAGDAGQCAWAVVFGQIEGGLSLSDQPKASVPADVRARAEELQKLLSERAKLARASR